MPPNSHSMRNWSDWLSSSACHLFLVLLLKEDLFLYAIEPLGSYIRPLIKRNFMFIKILYIVDYSNCYYSS